jgi:hypothetical protein
MNNKVKNIDKIVSEFERIRDLGFLPNNRPNNKDGGIGNTFEDHLGVKENNLKDPDFIGFEVKSKRIFNESYLSLFSKSPSQPKGANRILKDRFGEERDSEFVGLKKLYASIFGHRCGIVYDKYNMKLQVDRDSEHLKLVIMDLNMVVLYDEVIWSFDSLRKASSKINKLFIVYADSKKIDGLNHFHYKEGEIYLNFNFDKFLNQIENGGIMFDIRIGVHKTEGRNYGKPHDHGSGFRVKKEKIRELFDDYMDIT